MTAKNLTENTNADSHIKSYTKPIAISTARSDIDLSVRKLKALGAIHWATRNAFLTRNPQFLNIKKEDISLEMINKSDKTIAIEENLLLQAMGYSKGDGFYSFTQVLKVIEEISDQKIYFDSFGIAERLEETDDWNGFTRFISSVNREDGFFFIEMPAYIIYRLISPHPDASFEAPLSLSSLTSKYSFRLLDFCSFHYQKSDKVTNWISLDMFRELFNLQTDYYSQFSRIREKCIYPAIKNINESSQIGFSVELETSPDSHDLDGNIIKGTQKTGRKKIQDIRFIIREKTGISPIPNLQFENELSIQKSELRALGIASNQIDSVLDECRDNDNNIMLEYIVWCNRRGNDLRNLTSYLKSPLNEFGGIYRKQVIRGNRENWIQTNNMLNEHLENNYRLTPDDSNFKTEKMLLNERVKKVIIENHLRGISEFALKSIKDSFLEWIKIEKPSYVEQCLNECEEQSLLDLSGEVFYMFTVFLREEYNLFTPAAYSSALATA
ncbi:replication initiation protein [Pseudoalteromonas sp. OFAV1]|uniref:replication initiation protein n=1 Tax=Pseudoalteromonas sp. OFAV1 TaxID=2908892 RepID=UPI001F2F04E3|nr:replication initiation protein [Pseudoalteromonas sp. OFAV1]MCF2903085.1 replication initiation protein [Pseudoalteromonas sp. OFAV1]